MRNREVLIVIEGNPIAKMRARIRAGFVKRFYDAQQHEKQWHKILVANQFGSSQFFDGPCSMDVTYYMPIKKSHRVAENSYHFYKPDTDNLLKWTMDLLSSIAYKDDCIVCDISMRKLYSYKPRTEIILKELDYEQKERRNSTKTKN